MIRLRVVDVFHLDGSNRSIAAFRLEDHSILLVHESLAITAGPGTTIITEHPIQPGRGCGLLLTENPRSVGGVITEKVVDTAKTPPMPPDEALASEVLGGGARMLSVSEDLSGIFVSSNREKVSSVASMDGWKLVRVGSENSGNLFLVPPGTPVDTGAAVEARTSLAPKSMSNWSANKAADPWGRTPHVLFSFNRRPE